MHSQILLLQTIKGHYNPFLLHNDNQQAKIELKARENKSKEEKHIFAKELLSQGKAWIGWWTLYRC